MKIILAICAGCLGAGAAFGTPYMWRITEDPAYDTDPAWSPQGDKIAFVSGRSGSHDIWVTSYKGGPAFRVTTFPRLIGEYGPTWSPDGALLAFDSNFGGNFDIWVIPATGGEAIRLTNSPADECDPDWSPTGNKLAFARFKTNGYSNLFILDLDSHEEKQLTFHEPALVAGPTWSPDGRYIAYEHWGPDGDHIWIIPAEGGTPRRLTSYGGQNFNPEWSPDGRLIAFSSTRSGSYRIWAIPLRGEPAFQVTFLTFEQSCCWSPDGRYIAFETAQTGGRDIYGMVFDHDAVKPTSLGRIKAMFK